MLALTVMIAATSIASAQDWPKPLSVKDGSIEKASNATPKDEWLGAGTAPMLVMTCLRDIVAVPENALNIAKKRPNTWLFGIPNCGHNMLFEQPEVLRQQIVSFIQSDFVQAQQSYVP